MKKKRFTLYAILGLILFLSSTVGAQSTIKQSILGRLSPLYSAEMVKPFLCAEGVAILSSADDLILMLVDNNLIRRLK